MALAKDNYLLARCRRLAPRFDLVISASQEAADKIMLVLESAGRQRQLRNYLARRAAQFSADHFVIRLRELVDGFKAI
jgi:hypothetical protein